MHDPSRFSLEKTGHDEPMVLLYNLFEGVTSMPELLHLFHASNPPKQRHEWCVPTGNVDQVGELLKRIAKWRREG